MQNSKWFKIGICILLVSLNILVLSKISFVFLPLLAAFKTVLTPLIVGGVLYYLTKPLVVFLEAKKFPRTAAILTVFCLILVLILLLILYLVPVLKTQFAALAENLPKLVSSLQTRFAEFRESNLFSRVENLEIIQNLQGVDLTAVLDTLIGAISGNALSVVGSVFNVIVVIFTAPIFLFYLLKDREKIFNGMLNLMPVRSKSKATELLKAIDQTLSAYLSGLLTVAFLIALLAYIGYRIFGIEYALLLAVIAGVTEIIPYVGPILGTIPGMLLGLTYSPLVALEVLIMMVVIQQIESRVITPVVFGKKLNLHPLVILSLLLVAGALSGVVGMILAVPLFAALKTTLTYVVKWRKEAGTQKK